MTDVRIRVEGLTVKYDGRPALQQVSLAVREGEFVALVGRSGSGKTTLLNAVANFVHGEGRVTVRGRIGVVFQDHAAFPWMTVADNIAFGLGGKSRAEKRLTVEWLLHRVELDMEAGKYPAQLSGGQVQRVGLARALAPDPDILLMDEPYAALDRFTRESMQTWLLEVLGERAKTVLFVTHDIEEALFLADRVVVIAQGRVVREILCPLERPRREEAKFSQPFIEAKRAILEAMRLGG